jgi:putative hydrolase of the HAD superfamily
MGYQAILFDIDGTLVDVDFGGTVALDEFHRDYGHELGLTRREIGTRWQLLFDRYYTDYLEGRLSFAEQKRARIRALFDKQRPLLSDPCADEIFESYAAICRHSWRPYPEVCDALSALRTLPLAILSNGDDGEQRTKLQKCNLDHFFCEVFTPRTLGWCKPYPEAFKAACQRLNIAPSHCLYVGDRLDIDAKASAEAGLGGVWLNRPGNFEGKEAGVICISSLLELISFVKAQIEHGKDEPWWF